MAGSPPRLPVVPGVARCQYHVAGQEGDVLASTPVKFCRPVRPKRTALRVRRHDFVGIVLAIGRVQRGHRRAARRQARVDEDQRTAVGVLGGDQARRLGQQGLDVVAVRPAVRHRPGAVGQLADVVVRAVSRAQNGNMCLRSICSYMDSNSAARIAGDLGRDAYTFPLNGYQDSAEQNLITTNGCVNAILVLWKTLNPIFRPLFFWAFPMQIRHLRISNRITTN